MTKASHALASLPHHIGAGRRVRPRAVAGSGASARHRPLPALCLALLSCAALLALAPSAASAHQARVFAGSLGAADSTVVDPYPLADPASVAVDHSAGPSRGDVYVTDPADHRVEKFDSSGHLLLMFGKEVNKGAVEAHGTEAEEDICAAGEECQAGTAAETPGAFANSFQLFIAVDSSSGASRGDVYVAGVGGVIGGEGASPKVTKFDESGHLLAGWGNATPTHDGQLAPGTPPVGVITGLAVDGAGNLWVIGWPGTINTGVEPQALEFDAEAALKQAWIAGAAQATYGLALDAEDDLYFGNPLFKFGATGAHLGQVTPPGAGSLVSPQNPKGPTVDPSSGDLYLDGEDTETREQLIYRYDSSCRPAPTGFCAPAESFGSGHGRIEGGLATDPTTAADSLYGPVPDRPATEAGHPDGRVLDFKLATVPDVATLEASGFAPGTATLNGTVDPDGVQLDPGTEGCRFEWGEAGHPYEHTEVPCDKTAAQIGTGHAPVEVHATITGLQQGHSYHFRFLAANAGDVNSVADEPQAGADLSFGPPLVESASALAVAATSATLEAEIDPQNVPTSYRFEYLTEAEYLQAGETFAGAAQAPLPAGAIAALPTGQSVTEALQGLQPSTAYRYRVTAESALGAAVGEALSFTTQAAAVAPLPDHRAWELVSPAHKQGARLTPRSTIAPLQAAADGNAIAYAALSPTEAGPAGYALEVEVLSARAPGGGWLSTDLAAPHPRATGVTVGTGIEYKVFSPDLSRALLQPFGAFEPALSPAASEQGPYLRADFAPSGPPGFCAESCYRPLLSACPSESSGEECPPAVAALADLPPGTAFGEEGECPPQPNCGPRYLGATPDLSHLVLRGVGGLPRAPFEVSPGLPPTESVRPLGVLPDGAAAPAAAVGFLSQEGARNAISADGSRVAFSVGSGPEKHLYLRLDATAPQSEVSGPAVDGSQCTEAGRACTVQLDALQGGSGAGQAEPRFQLASADGRRVFFTDYQRLTSNSLASYEKPNLYEYDLDRPAGERLADLTPLAEPGLAQGLTGASEDASYLYFVARGVLASNVVENGGGPEEAQAGRPNLYLRHDGATSFIAGLAPEDGKADFGSLEDMAARVSPDGRRLSFLSSRPLTGYDNRDAASGRRDEEVFLYHAPAGGAGEGTLLCASCDPSGARPRGVEYGSLEGGPLGSHHTLESDTWVAALTAAWRTTGSGVISYQPRFLSDSGRLFFETPDALVPQDSNGTWDVYEYEPPAGPEEPGSDTCTEASPTYSASSEGCVDLISSGTASEESAFLDASESGDDAFFLSAARLSAKDKDTAFDVYDARVGGGEAEESKPVECLGDACQPPAVPPNDQTPGSLTFNGAGNVKECPAGKQLKQGKCVKQKSKPKKKHHKKHTKHHKKKTHNKAKKSKRANTNRGGAK